MINMKTTRIFTVLFALSLLFSISCRSDDPVDQSPKGMYESGYLVANEGSFGTPTASVSFIPKDLSKIENNIFSGNNSGALLGDILQHIGFNGTSAYLVLNNSNKIVVADRYTMKKQADITTEINQPRYVAFTNNLVYVTNSAYNGAHFVSIYKTADHSYLKKLTFSEPVERIVEAGGKIFVQHASYGTGNKISVIETTGNTVSSTITIPTGNINKIISNGGFVYVIAPDGSNSNIFQYSAAGTLIKTIALTGISYANNLEIEGGDFFFTSSNKIYRMSTSASSVPASPLITVPDNSFSTLYGFSVMDGKIFTSDANGFSGASKISVYSTSGALLKTFEAGKGTNGFYNN